MGKHTDSIECDCLTIAIKPTDGMMVDHCQYLHCLRVNEATGRFGGYLTRATDGTQMHPECWSAYDREWRTLHPETNQAIVDGMTEQAEKRAGA